jgi:hypothetical protein
MKIDVTNDSVRNQLKRYDVPGELMGIPKKVNVRLQKADPKETIDLKQAPGWLYNLRS